MAGAPRGAESLPHQEALQNDKIRVIQDYGWQVSHVGARPGSPFPRQPSLSRFIQLPTLAQVVPGTVESLRWAGMQTPNRERNSLKLQNSNQFPELSMNIKKKRKEKRLPKGNEWGQTSKVKDGPSWACGISCSRTHSLGCASQPSSHRKGLLSGHLKS